MSDAMPGSEASRLLTAAASLGDMGMARVLAATARERRSEVVKICIAG